MPGVFLCSSHLLVAMEMLSVYRPPFSNSGLPLNGNLDTPCSRLSCCLLCVFIDSCPVAPVDSDPHEWHLEMDSLFFECLFDSCVSSTFLHHFRSIVVVKEYLLAVYVNFLLPYQLQDCFFHFKLLDIYDDGPWICFRCELPRQGSKFAGISHRVVGAPQSTDSPQT